MTDAAAINLRILQQGAVRVSHAYAYRSAPGIACVYLDLHSKYADKPSVGREVGRPPRLYLGAGENTLRLNENARGMDTVIEFTDFPGWEVFSCSDPARYTIALTLVAPEAPASGN